VEGKTRIGEAAEKGEAAIETPGTVRLVEDRDRVRVGVA
jgi:hypothetical protein